MKNMGLINKLSQLKEKGKRIALAGIISLSSIASGCVSPGGMCHVVTYDSVPRGAHIFLNGQYMGNTPADLRFFKHIGEEYTEIIECPSVICAKEGFVPERVELRIKSPPQSEYGSNAWSGFNKAHYNHTFFLKSDPNYVPPPRPVEPEPNISIIPTLIFPINR